MRSTIGLLCLLIDWCLQLGNDPQMYWSTDNIIIQPRDSEVFSKINYFKQLFSHISLQKESRTSRALQHSLRSHCLYNFCLAVLFFTCPGLCFQSLLRLEEELAFILSSYLLWKKIGRLDGRHVTRQNVHQCLSAVSVPKKSLHYRGIYRYSIPQKILLAPRLTRQRKFSLHPWRIVFRDILAVTNFSLGRDRNEANLMNVTSFSCMYASFLPNGPDMVVLFQMKNKAAFLCVSIHTGAIP